MSERLNVLFLPSWYPSDELPVNGIFVREYAKAVSLKHNVAVLYLATQAGPYRDYDDEGIRTIKHAVPFSGAGIGLARYIRQGLRDFAQLHRSFRPDLIHVHMVYPAGLLAMAIALRYRIPLVLSEQMNPFAGYMSNMLKRVLVRRAMAAAQVICPISLFLQRQMEQQGAKGPFVIVPNVVNTRLFTACPPAPRAAGEPKRIVLIALLDYPADVPDIKGINYLLRGLAQLSNHRDDFTLDIIGDGPKRAEYEATAAELQLNDKVRFLGMKAKVEVARLLHDYDFLVMPSLSESMGVVVIEALASGKPVVSTRCGGPEEVLTEQVGLLVDKASVKALCGGVAWMLDHYRDYDPQAIAAYARSRYTYEAVAAQFDAVYRQALGTGKRQ